MNEITGAIVATNGVATTKKTFDHVELPQMQTRPLGKCARCSLTGEYVFTTTYTVNPPLPWVPERTMVTVLTLCTSCARKEASK